MTQLPSLTVPLTPGKVRCVGCYQEKDQLECAPGRINKGVDFAKKITQELVWDPDKSEMVTEDVEKTFPVGKWARGMICRSCASDYRTVTHTRKNGEIWYEPVVILNVSPTQSRTLAGTHESPRGEVTYSPSEDAFGFEPLPEKDLDVKAFRSLYKKGTLLDQKLDKFLSHTKRGARKSEAQLNAEANRG